MSDLFKEIKDIDIKKLHPHKRKELLLLLEALKDKQEHNKIKNYYPDSGNLARDKYPKHLEFFAATKKYSELVFLAGNRSGKTFAGAYALTTFLTGDYPTWWPGRVFPRPVDCWASGDTSETTRDIMQLALFGPIDDIGSGLIPRDRIISYTRKAGGVPNVIDLIRIENNYGGTSKLSFKCSKQGRKSYEGTRKDVIWIDEEAPYDIYNEALLRTMSTDGTGRGGIIYTTFTPLMGLSDMVMSFLPKKYSFSEAA